MMEKIRDNKKKVISAVSVLVCVGIIGIYAGVMEGSASAKDASGSTESVSLQKESDKAEKKKTVKKDDPKKDTKKETAKKAEEKKETEKKDSEKKADATKQEQANASGDSGNNGNANTESSADNTGSTSSGDVSGSSSVPAKVWHEPVYEQRYVVDQAAWVETVSEPIYTTVERSICSVCGADITGNTTAHSRNHALAGEGGGYYSDVQTIQTGTNTYTIPHAEVGHYENVLVSEGYWE